MNSTESDHVLTETSAAHGQPPFPSEKDHVGDQINWHDPAIHSIQVALSKPTDTPQGASR